MLKLFDTAHNVKMQVQKKRRENKYGGMWGSANNFIGGGGQKNHGNHGNQQNNNWGQQQNNNYGGNDGWGHQQGGNQHGNQGWGNQGNNDSWGNMGGNMGNQNLGHNGLAMALVANQNLWGNNLSGGDWVREQLKRQSYNIMPSQDAMMNMSDLKNVLEKQITFLEPSPVQKKLQELRKQGKTFYDDRFPPNKTSLSGNQPAADWAQIQWKKISEIMPKAKIFQGKIEPDDIKQGYLGDCYLLAAFAAIAQRPDRIFSLFLTTQMNPQKYFSVKILYKGKWMTIDMDQYIPVLYGKPAFTKAKDDELWVVLLEKAWAKLYKNYKQISAGFPEQGLHDFTGAPIHQLYLKQSSFNPEQSWNYLLMASQKEYAMVASSQPGSDTQKSVSGIVQGHAYTFLHATVLNYQGGSDRIVEMRNPWGKGQSKGKWSDSDPHWSKVSPQQKQRVGFNPNIEDGTFFMTYEAFLAEFRALTVAQINDNASYIYRSMKDKEKRGVYFKVQIVQKGYYSLQIDKTPDRIFDQSIQSGYHYPRADLEIGKITSNGCQKLEPASSSRRSLYKGYDLSPGAYVVYVKVAFDDQWQKDFQINLAIYAEYACDIEVASKQEVVLFTGNQNVNWDPSQHQSKKSWNPMGNSDYQGSGWGGGGGNNHNSGWGNDNNNDPNQGWGNNNNQNNWGNPQPKKDDGWGNPQNNNHGNQNNWGNHQKKDDGWGNPQPKKDDGWGNPQNNNHGNQNNWGNHQKKDDGWGNPQPKKDDGWGNPQPKKDDGWGNPQPKKDDGWGNSNQNNGW